MASLYGRSGLIPTVLEQLLVQAGSSEPVLSPSPLHQGGALVVRQKEQL